LRNAEEEEEEDDDEDVDEEEEEEKEEEKDALRTDMVEGQRRLNSRNED